MEGGHPILGLDGTDPSGRHALAIDGILDDTDAAPIPPVENFHRTGPGLPKLVRKGVLEGAASRIVALARRFEEGLHGGEEEDKVQGLIGKHLGQTHADVHLGREPGAETFLVHLRQGLVEQDDGGVDHAMDVAVGGLDLFISGLQLRLVASISLNIQRPRANASQSIQISPNGLVLSTATNPDEVRPVGCNHEAAPGFADAACPADDHIDAAGTVEI